MTLDELIADLERLHVTASPLPWRWDDKERPDDIWDAQEYAIISTDTRCYGPSDEDAALIFYCRNRLPEIIALLQTLRPSP